MRRRLLLASMLLVAATACSSAPSTVSPDPGGTGPTHASLVAAADLRPCPASSSTAVPDGLPNITLPCLGNGPQVHLAGLTGKPTVVNIWGSWCEPCQAEMRYLSSAYDRDRPRVRFLGVDSIDQADSALDFDAHVTPPVRYPSVFDLDHKVDTGLKTESTPYTVFVSALGKIVHTHAGPYLSTAAVQADIATYLHVSA